MVHNNVHEFMAYKKYIAADAPMEEALKKFDELVHTLLPGFLYKSTGRVGLRWTYLAAVGAASWLPTSLDIWAAQYHERTPRQRVLELSHPIVMTLGIMPLWFALESHLVRWCLNLKGKRAWVLYALTVPVSVTFVLVLYHTSNESCVRGGTSDAWASLFIVFEITICLFTYMAFRPPKIKDSLEGDTCRKVDDCLEVPPEEERPPIHPTPATRFPKEPREPDPESPELAPELAPAYRTCRRTSTIISAGTIYGSGEPVSRASSLNGE